MPVLTVRARLEQHSKVGEVALMANLMIGRPGSASADSRAELVLTPVVSTVSVEMLRCGHRTLQPLEAIMLHSRFDSLISLQAIMTSH